MRIQRYAVIETALCIGGNVLDGEVEMVRASDHEAELAALREELADMQHWRDLALQFDHHRMMAMWHLKTLVSDGAHYDAACKFLEEPPIPASELQQRLTAAEQRNAEIVGLLTEHQWEWQPYDEHYHRDGGYYCLSCKESQKDGHAKGCAIDDALKPIESGASE